MSAHNVRERNRQRLLSASVVPCHAPQAHHVVRGTRHQRVGIREGRTVAERRFDDLGDLTPAVVSKYPINTVRYYTYSTVDRYLESAGGRCTAIPDYALVWS